ncbi:MAG: serine--tRNA ligase [Bacteroidetes bacterium CG02_land_8_20_14_3_00_31_25]|nr:serine--tRNA ligase [Bacteroidota bacterium]PIV58226.1 MAG: serine--tRNA ligase [Bacteroidetes bacterium CG02_land_8_20_14_3_00_31_25]
MLTLKLIQENTEFVIERLAVKNVDARNKIEKIIELDNKRKAVQNQSDKKLAELNKVSQQIGGLIKSGQKEEADNAKKVTVNLKEEIKQFTQQLADAEKELKDVLITLPNLPHSSVPKGKSAENNEVVRTGGPAIVENSNLLPHWELAKKYDIIDFDLGNKITGAGFPVYKGKGAKFQRSLISFFLDEAINAGFREVIPPFMVNEDSGYGTGQLPDKEGQMYHDATDNFYLIPTAEVPVTNIFRDVVVNESDFPVKYTAYSPCFRREAGSYGKDVRGLNRLHQFDKVEIVVIANPKDSYSQLELMVKHVESLVTKLGLPYRILRLCGGDMGFTSALTYDFEVYSEAQKRWLEVSSVSNFETFQANRLKLRYKDEATKKNQLAHTLNGSALALPRIVAALLENNQTSDGIIVPEVLIPYTGFKFIN